MIYSNGNQFGRHYNSIHETEMLTLTMCFLNYLKECENIRYFIKQSKYKYCLITMLMYRNVDILLTIVVLKTGIHWLVRFGLRFSFVTQIITTEKMSLKV